MRDLGFRIDDLRWRTNGSIETCRVAGREPIVASALALKAKPDAALLLVLVITGECRLSQSDRTVAISRGCFGICDYGKPLTLHASEDHDILLVACPRGVLYRGATTIDAVLGRSFGDVASVGTVAASYLRRLPELLDEHRRPTKARLADVAIDLIAMAMSESAPAQPSVSWARTEMLGRIKSYVLDRLTTTGLKTQDVASALNISSRYLHSLFSDEGTTFATWLWRQRLEACRAKIESSASVDQSIGDIAVEFGFSNFSHFSKRFKEAYGMAARDMRRKTLGMEAQEEAVG
jgi:AraC-like DNA-binding protein